MSGFKLDTSGAVIVERGSVLTKYRWSDLSPFAQGYIEAAFEEWFWEQGVDGQPFLGFSDLAPATLAAMLEDCASRRLQWSGYGGAVCRRRGQTDAEAGTEFWRHRYGGAYKRFAPLTLYLADDVKIHQREVGQ